MQVMIISLHISHVEDSKKTEWLKLWCFSASDYILYRLDHCTIENTQFQIIIVKINFLRAPLEDLQDLIVIKLHFYAQWCSLGF